MIAPYLLLAASLFNAGYAFEKTCLGRLCYGPKFRQSNCCKGYICVALYKDDAEDVLECVDEEGYLEVKNLADLLHELDLKYGESDTTENNKDQTLLMDENSLANLVNKVQDFDDSVFDMVGFNNPVMFDNQTSTMKM